MTSVISKQIIKILCDNHGGLDFKQLNAKLAQSQVSNHELRTALFDDGKIVVREGEKQATGGLMIGQDSVVVAKTSLRLCQKKPGNCGGLCDELHLCRYYVGGGCTFGQKCKNPHTLKSPHNVELLARHSLNDLTEKQLFQLLLQNDPYLLPEVCTHYNKGDGQFGSCRFNTSCTKLHVCQHYLQGDCTFGSSCKRAHAVGEHGMKLLKGLSQENLQNLHKIYRNKFIILGQQGRPAVVSVPKVSQQAEAAQGLHPPSQNSPATPTSSAGSSKPKTDAERNEICLFFLRKLCSYKDKCARNHWHLPYRWQVLDRDGVTWKDLEDMEDIEKAYCDPARDTSCENASPDLYLFLGYFMSQSSTSSLKQYVDFKTMTYDGSQVRRLSTPSSVTKPPHFILTTQWLWYWKENDGKWLEYGESNGNPTVSSEILENIYLADGKTEISFQAGKHQYALHFKDATGTLRMYQQNIEYKTEREVRRRPCFVSSQDVDIKLRGSSHTVSSSTAEDLPPYWNQSALPEYGYKLVQLGKPDMIEALFKRTMPQSKITSIERIQNPSLWRVFKWQEQQMQMRNAGKLVNQQYLFHGTDESLIDPICDQNFDWRMCGVHGTAYGKGSYFARDASYSNKYANKYASGQNKIMFVALVLVGEYTQGRSSYVRPPAKGKGFYDSCVDNVSNPSIYVIFEKMQIYPEYLIRYV